MPTFSPEFDTYSPDVLKACVQQGAAKVAGMISDESIERLARPGAQSMSAQGILAAAPELEEVRRHIQSNGRASFTMVAAFRNKAGEDPRFQIRSHPDTESPKGITLVIPVTGKKALFAAADQPFNLREDGRVDVEPHLLWEYGPTDVMFLRQGLRKVNRQKVKFGMAQHNGRSEGYRLLRMLDFRSRKLKLPIDLDLAS